MQNVVKAFGESFKALFSFKIIFLMLVPPIVAFVGSVLLFFIFWQKSLVFISGLITQTWVFDYITKFAEKDFVWLANGISAVALILLFIPLSYLFSLIITSLFIMPQIQNHLAEEKFKTLEKKQGGSFLGSIFNLFSGTTLYLIGFVLTLPLWLVPGLQILMPMLLTAWLNQHVLAYDSLQDFASKEERKQLIKSQGSALYGIGFFCSVLVYIPFVSFFAPVFSGLTFTFFNLRRLESLRISGSAEISRN